MCSIFLGGIIKKNTKIESCFMFRTPIEWLKSTEALTIDPYVKTTYRRSPICKT